jgi:hypothetical protein
MSDGGYTEDHLVERPAIQLLRDELGWDPVNCFGEWDGGTSSLGRDGKREVVLPGRLKPNAFKDSNNSRFSRFALVLYNRLI